VVVGAQVHVVVTLVEVPWKVVLAAWSVAAQAESMVD